MKKFFAILTMVVTAIITYSQAPQKLSYQAVIRNSSGQLVTNHAVGIRTTILQGSPSGSVVYQETFNSLSNANGLVSIELGGGTPVSGTFAAINWASGSYYLRTETDPSGGTSYTISGTSQLISVPYALHAKNAASYTETDPVFGASPSKAITSGLITNWNSAYSWGNHAGLYKLVSYVPAWNEITGKPTSISGYGITDAVTLTGDQTISGIKTFNSDLLVNGLTIGRGNNSQTDNTAFGRQVLSTNTTGKNNTANGYAALYSNTIGNYNTANGVGALFSNTIGCHNTANGVGTLYYNTTGYNNTAIGEGAGRSNKTGNSNVFLGFLAGNFETGSNKLFIDNQSRSNEADGRVKALIYGVFDASPANQSLTINGNATVTGNLQIGGSYGPITSNWWEFGTDSNNGTAIDFHSNTSPTDFSARIYRLPGNNAEFQLVNAGTGNLAFYTASTQRMTVTGTGNVGIGTATPAYMLDVKGDITSRAPSGNGFRLWGSSYSTFFRNDNVDFYILLTNAGNPDGGWNTLRPFSINLPSGNVYLGGKALTVLHGGNVGIGTETPGTKLAISGLTGSTTGSALIINGGNVYFLGSTRDIKDNIRPLDDDFSKILLANPVSFTDKNTGMKGMGYIAEEFEEAGLQNLLVYEKGELVSLRYDLVSVYTLEIIKEQQDQLRNQQKQIEDQQKLIENQQRQIDEIRQALQLLRNGQ